MQSEQEYIIPNRRDVDAEGFFLFGIMVIMGILFITFYFGLPALKTVLQPASNPSAVTTTSATVLSSH